MAAAVERRRRPPPLYLRQPAHRHCLNGPWRPPFPRRHRHDLPSSRRGRSRPRQRPPPPPCVAHPAANDAARLAAVLGAPQGGVRAPRAVWAVAPRGPVDAGVRGVPVALVVLSASPAAAALLDGAPRPSTTAGRGVRPQRLCREVSGARPPNEEVAAKDALAYAPCAGRLATYACSGNGEDAVRENSIANPSRRGA